MKKFLFLFVVLFFTLPTTLKAQVKLGIDVLEESGFKCLNNKRVGLLTHPAGINSKGQSTLDILWKNNRVNLVALYGPEHGIYGNEKANMKIAHHTDEKTGLIVYSLYGEHRRPSPAMLQGIDVMVIDLQDIGTRSYTYVSCMCYTMEECFRGGIDVIVLDRPNPLGGVKVDGPIMEKAWSSYVGLLPIPYVHGLTIGELARICKQESGWLSISDEVRRKGKLTVVSMKGWDRSMLWPETGLQWVPTSPAIQDFNAVLGYPMTGLGCQMGGFHHGYAPDNKQVSYPFRLLSFPNRKPIIVERALKARRIPGITFCRKRADNKKYIKEPEGLYIHITNYDAWNPTELSFHMMQLACQWNEKNPFSIATESNSSLFNKHVGSSAWWSAISSQGHRANLASFLKRWKQESKNFQTWSKQFWLY